MPWPGARVFVSSTLATPFLPADAFVAPAYFTDDEYYEKLDKELTWLANMRDEGIRRIAARTVGLSPEAKKDLADKVDELRRQENLDS